MTNLRVTDTQGFLLYREVEPVQPYPRIDPQQPHDEKARGQDQSRAKKDELARRRFVAMRGLIEGLRSFGRFERLDYLSLVKELGNIGIAVAERELFSLLRSHGITDEGLSHLAAQIRGRMSSPDLGFGPPLDEEHNPLPFFSRGLLQVHLRYTYLELLPGQEGAQVVDAIAGEGLYRCGGRYVQAEFRPQVRTQYDSALDVDVRIMIAVGEMDEEKRRAILFERAPGVFALYTDKQISLSI